MNLFLKYAAIQLKSQMQFKMSFFLTILGQFLGAFSAFLSIYFMFTRFNTVNGFEYAEVLLCFAATLMAFSLSECIARGFDYFSVIIRNCEFDRVMVRPKNEILQVLAMHIDFTRLGRLLQASLVFTYAIPASGVEWTPLKILILVLMVLSGTVIFSCLFLIYAVLCFFTTEGLEFINIFTDGGREFGRYPFAIYGKNVLRIFTFVIPLALFQYYPFIYITGHSENKFYMLTPVIGIFFALPCLLIWKIGVSRYKSNGS